MKRKTGFSLSSIHLVFFLMVFMGLTKAGGTTTSITSPTTGMRNTEITDLKPHASTSKTYNEFWTYQFFLDGNVQAFLNFSRVNLGSYKSPVCGADLTVLSFKNKNYSVAREYEKKNFVFTDSNSQLRVHEKIWFDGRLPTSHHVHFATTKKDVSYFLDLNFSEIEQGKVWGDGMFKFGPSDAVGIFIHIPNAKVKGVLAIDKDTLQVSGQAYMDHTFQTDMAPNLVSAGYRYISQSGPLEVGYFLTPVSQFGSQPIGFGLRQSDAGMTLLKPASLKIVSSAKALGVKVPTLLEIRYQDESKAALSRKDDRFQQSTLHEFSGFTKMAIKNFMGGEVFTFKGFGNLNGTRSIGYNYFTVE